MHNSQSLVFFIFNFLKKKTESDVIFFSMTVYFSAISKPQLDQFALSCHAKAE